MTDPVNHASRFPGRASPTKGFSLALQSANRLQRRADQMVWIAVAVAALIIIFMFVNVPF